MASLVQCSRSRSQIQSRTHTSHRWDRADRAADPHLILTGNPRVQKGLLLVISDSQHRGSWWDQSHAIWQSLQDLGAWGQNPATPVPYRTASISPYPGAGTDLSPPVRIPASSPMGCTSPQDQWAAAGPELGPPITWLLTSHWQQVHDLSRPHRLSRPGSVAPGAPHLQSPGPNTSMQLRRSSAKEAYPPRYAQQALCSSVACFIDFALLHAVFGERSLGWGGFS
ncbi:hypothetical protein NDU88_004035 [Pleurodeles waltl]|uniref:Uncharacterized protein n=1 Tax=Pleurodeles waltl TaxID=8319 RepID=A0AAV7TST8_PLEWA|nr:hypothetical protein NDU88_004035 [Pleurodeles waltl]